ncbi:MAG: peptide deformylase [Candidatus Paceibacterota bacterium]|jgi:peptide deformylase
MKEILQEKGNAVLHTPTNEIPVEDIKSPKIQKIIKEMSQALLSQDDGVALAGPQIGYPLSIFIVSGKIFDRDFIESKEERVEGEGNIKKAKQKVPDMVYINPRILKLSKDKEWIPEGCLSARWLYGRTHRSKKATITAYDENGKKFVRGASGLLAQIFQHETDHLKGVMFTDHAKDIIEEGPVL